MSNARNISALSTVEVGATADQTKSDIDALGIDTIAASLKTELKSGRKNLLINGGFAVSQRGDFTSMTSTGSCYRHG